MPFIAPYTKISIRILQNAHRKDLAIIGILR